MHSRVIAPTELISISLTELSKPQLHELRKTLYLLSYVYVYQFVKSWLKFKIA